MHLFFGTTCARFYRYSFPKYIVRWLKNATYLQASEKCDSLKVKFQSASGIQEYLQHIVNQHYELTQLLALQVVHKLVFKEL